MQQRKMFNIPVQESMVSQRTASVFMTGLFPRLFCSFDYLKDELGAPRSTFPHMCYMVAGTQATSAKQNYVAFLRLANLGQGRHGKKAKKEEEDESDDESMSESSGDSEEDEEWDEHGPPRMHVR
eukprot:1156510-Pelagomonas_calceolata.AAC.2